MNARSLIDALSLWEATGSQIARAARETSDLLARNGIPNLIAGGIAVQLHGYARFTNDVDLVVRDMEGAHRLLISNGYRQSLRKLICAIHPLNVDIDLLPAGRCLEMACKVPFPEPTDTQAVMQPVTMEDLVSLKLDSWSRRPANRGQDRVDVAKLISNNGLPRDFPVHPAMLAQYHAIWDELAEERERLGTPPES